MSLDERGLNILKLLVNNPTISGSQLEKEAGLSRKQLSYSLAKINFYLKENGFEEIGRMRTGKFIIPHNVSIPIKQISSPLMKVRMYL